MLDPTVQLILSDKNYGDAQREFARFLPPYSIEERDGMLLSACGTMFPAAPFNAVSLTGSNSLEPSRIIDEARAFFDGGRRSFGVMVKGHRDHALAAFCEQYDLPHFGDAPGMLLDGPVEQSALPAGTEVRLVRTMEDAAQFAHVAAHAFEDVGLPLAVGRKLLSRPQAWLQPHWRVHLIVEHGKPVAGAMALSSHGIAGIYWVATLAEARGRGYGEAVTRAIANDAFARGAAAVVLQASRFGEPVYRRIGFREITRYHWYLVAA